MPGECAMQHVVVWWLGHVTWALFDLMLHSGLITLLTL